MTGHPGSPCEWVDTFPAFLAWWSRYQDRPLDDQIEGWEREYMALWPELLSRQIEDYEGLDWRQIARQRVFPYLSGWLPAMRQAHQNLLDWGEPLYSRAQQMLSFESEATWVIYVGIGCGAGWATTFGGLPAILFGLESIAGCGWSDVEAITGLLGHEFGHLAHDHWRRQVGKSRGSGPWWQLYEEGFAQHCEQLIAPAPRWRQARGDDRWLEWCQSHEGWLAREYLKAVDAGESVSAFFGSWFEICGRSETGYFLGYKAIESLKRRLDLKEIALLENVEDDLRPILEQMAAL